MVVSRHPCNLPGMAGLGSLCPGIRQALAWAKRLQDSTCTRSITARQDCGHLNCALLVIDVLQQIATILLWLSACFRAPLQQHAGNESSAAQDVDLLL